ncbi:CPBP family intramembrane metalloprotease [Candidatus Saccharibacteria bacterium]|nr:CPBP family intramembrane metalloprotease [Candidatus Saccharibacteria bacterium]
MLTLIGCIILGIVIFILMMMAFPLFNDSKIVVTCDENDEDSKVVRRYHYDGHEIGTAAVVAAVVAICNFMVLKLPVGFWGIGIIPLVVMLFFMWRLAKWWYEEGKTIKGMIPLIILEIIFFFVSKGAAHLFAAIIPSTFWGSVVTTIPTLALIASIGFMVIDYFYYCYRKTDETDGAALLHHVIGVIAIVVTTILLICAIASGVKWGYLQSPHDTHVANAEDVAETEPETEPETEEETTPAVWYSFYNTELLSDDDPDNDLFFGSNPYEEGKDAEFYDEVFRDRLKVDPALAAADMAWLDANVGTRFMGEFYESCHEDWALAMNSAKERFMEDQENYYASLHAFFRFLDRATVRVEYRENAMDDQMFFNPDTTNNVPDIVVLETHEHSGWFIVYSFTIKGEVFDVAYRIDCGFQPTDVEDVMNITPQPQPTPAPTPQPQPTPTPTPTPEPETEPETGPHRPPKDPTQGTQGNVVAPNDDTGPGPDTNSGVGSTTSSADRPDTSTSYSSYDEYASAIDELESINSTQRVGGNSNAPSTPATSTNTNVDNNAVSGNGGAGVDTPTATSPLATNAATGETISNSPAEAWGGPLD